MARQRRQDVENLPADLDRFLGNFFDRRGWQAEIKFDPVKNRLFLDVRLEQGRLSDDDRFFSLVEYFVRTQGRTLRRAGGLSLTCRLFGADGADLTSRLHQRGASYLDDQERGTTMRRRLAWLGFRRRLLRSVLPGALMWTGALFVVTVVIGLSFGTAILLALGALAVQAVVTSLAPPRAR